MKLTAAIFFLPILALAQGAQTISHVSPSLSYHLTSYSQTEDVSYPAENIQRFIDKLDVKRKEYKNEKLFLGHVFGKTHQRYLKHYEEYARFSELFKKGSYNCLTGTALYALILDNLGFGYEIIETTHHIFLLAETADGQILFEATDPINGFVSDPDEVQQRIANYKRSTPLQASSNKTYYQFSTVLYNSIDLSEITGLLHYNMAVEAYNNKDLPLSVNHLDKAIRLYRSSRTEEFSRIILLTIMESKLDTRSKEELLRKIHSIRSNRMHVVASTKSF